jgi:DivIVA domain-containing protein
MTLSLDDVRNKRFRMARKGGYEVLEVDEFVDEVEESFAQLFEENASLKKQVEALRSGSGSSAEAAPAVPDATEVRAPEPIAASQPGPSQPAPVQTAPSAPVTEDRVVVTTSAEASTAVVRLVQLSTEQAEHLVREASAEAAHIREDAPRTAQQVTEDARTRAERLESEARVNAERVQAEAQTRSQALDQELSQRRTELFGDLDRQRDTLTETVARLRDFEQRYRSNLHDHLQGQLTTLEQVGLEPEGGPERTAPRSSATTGEAQPDGEAGPGVQQQGSQPAQGDGSTNGSPTSDTPRLDALLGEQR